MLHVYTVCTESLDPFYIASYYILNGSRLLGHTVLSISIYVYIWYVLYIYILYNLSIY